MENHIEEKILIMFFCMLTRNHPRAELSVNSFAMRIMEEMNCSVFAMEISPAAQWKFPLAESGKISGSHSYVRKMIEEVDAILNVTFKGEENKDLLHQWSNCSSHYSCAISLAGLHRELADDECP